MKNTFFILICFSLFFLISKASKCQEGFIGPQAGLSYYKGSGFSPLYGFTWVIPTGGNTFKEQIQFTYHPSLTLEGIDTVIGIVQRTSIPVHFTAKMKIIEAGFLTRWNISDNPISEGGIFPMLGIGLQCGINNVTCNQYDRQVHQANSFLDNDFKVITQVVFQGGIGYELMSSKHHFIGAQILGSFTYPFLNMTAVDNPWLREV